MLLYTIAGSLIETFYVYMQEHKKEEQEKKIKTQKALLYLMICTSQTFCPGCYGLSYKNQIFFNSEKLDQAAGIRCDKSTHTVLTMKYAFK